MEAFPLIAFIVLVVAVATIIPLGLASASKNRQAKARIRNAINNSIAGLIDKGAISSPNGDYSEITKKSGYKSENLVEQAIMAHGFDNKRSVSAKSFHINLRKKFSYLHNAVVKTDASKLDFETPPTQRIGNSTNDDSAFIFPLVMLGSMEGPESSHSNPHYTGDSGYSDFDGGDGGGYSSGDGGGYSGGDSGGGGDGGGGGGD